jgi:GT2 family glycosyltransferase
VGLLPELPEASVVVPTLERPAALASCLAALDGQVHVDGLEVIVVDAGVRQSDTVERIVGAHKRARLVRSAGSSPAAARNAGMRTARGRFVLFIDDDCTPVPQWAAKLLEGLRAGADAVAGRSVLVSSQARLAAATQVIFDYVTDPPESSRATAFATANNVGSTAELLAAVPFDERYAFASEDRDWCARIIASGRGLFVVRDAVVQHHEELTLSRFFRRHVAYGRGSFQFHRAHPSAGRIEPPHFYVGLLRKGFERGFAIGAAVVVAQLATGIGYGLAAWSDWHQRRPGPLPTP